MSITFSCGCEINEFAVLAMCVTHVVEMRRGREQELEQQRTVNESFLKEVGALMGPGCSGDED